MNNYPILDNQSENLMTDEKKVKALNNLELSSKEKIKIINSIINEDLKLQLLKENILPNEFDKLRIIRDFRNDNSKLKALKEINFKNNRHQINIIKTILSDENKLLALKITKISPFIKIQIILDFQSDESKLKALKEFMMLDKEKVKIIDSFKNDNMKIKALYEIKLKDNDKTQIILSLTEDNKIEALNLLSDKKEITRILVTLSDKNKLEILPQITDSLLQEMIICSIKDHDKRDELLKSFGITNKMKYQTLDLNPSMTLGIEIESEGLNSSVIRNYKYILPSWRAKEDVSLKNKGLEIISPILRDDLGDIASIYCICEYLKQNDQTVSYRCGGHIHIGANILTNQYSYINLLEIWCNIENILYIICNDIGEIPRKTLPQFAKSYSEILSEALDKGTNNLENETDLDEFVANLRSIQKDKYVNLNFLTYNNNYNTIEIRLANGTITPNTWIENILLFGKIIEIAEKMSHYHLDDLTPKQKITLLLKEKLNSNITDEEKLETLLELLSFTEEEKSIYRQRYQTNVKLLNQLPKENNPLYQIEFYKIPLNQLKCEIPSNQNTNTRTH